MSGQAARQLDFTTSRPPEDTDVLFGEEMAAIADEAASTEHELDNDKNKKILAKLEDWWYQVRLAQSENRYQMAIDDDFYDGDQWKDQDKLEVEDRGQAPLVFNEIRPSIDWIIGTERRSRIDFKVQPREEDDGAAAAAKTHLLKYVSDVNRTVFRRSNAFDDAVRVGVGWLEDGIKTDPMDEPLYSRNESWRNIWYDQLAQERDLSDGRFLFRSKRVDEDIAVSMFPERADKIRSCATKTEQGVHSDDDEFLISLYYNSDARSSYERPTSYIEEAGHNVHSRRPRVRLIEAWFRVPTRLTKMYIEDDKYKQFAGDVYDENNDIHKHLVNNFYATTYDTIQMQMYVAIFIEGSILSIEKSPYKHDQFPFTPIWAYRRKRDGACYGVIRNMRDPQEDLNKRRSKALFILSTNQVIMEEGAVADKDEMREQVADPSGVIVIRKNKKFEIREGTKIAQAHIAMESGDKEYIREVAGVTPDNLGHKTNATSGKAIERRQDQGSIVTSELFDNLRFAIQIQGEKELSLVEQYYDKKKTIRILGRSGSQHLILNNPMYGEGGEDTGIENDITSTKADFVVSEQDYRETIKLALHEQLMEMTAKLPPEIALNLLDVVIDMSDLAQPYKETLVQRIRKLNGQPDPDAEDTPENRAAEEEAIAKEEEKAAMEQAAIELEFEEKEAEIEKKKAETEKILAEAQQVRSEIGAEGGDPEQAEQVQQIIGEAQDRIAELERELAEVKVMKATKEYETDVKADTEIRKTKIITEGNKEIAQMAEQNKKELEGLENKLEKKIEALALKLKEAKSKPAAKKTTTNKK